MSKKRILYIAQEITPYLPENELSKFCLDLPKKMNDSGNEVRVFMPRFGVINERRHHLHEVIRLSGINIVINDLDMPLIIKVASVPQARMQVYFIDNEEYFKRKHTHFDDKGKAFADNEHRMIFFCKGVVETVKKLGWAPDIIHIQGWMGSFLPIYIKQYYSNDPLFADSKIVFSTYSYPYAESIYKDNKLADILKFDGIKMKDKQLLENPNVDNLQKFAIDHSDAVVKLAPTLNGLEEKLQELNGNFLDLSNVDGKIDVMKQFYKDLVSEETLA